MDFIFYRGGEVSDVSSVTALEALFSSTFSLTSEVGAEEVTRDALFVDESYLF